ncbi:MAG TPA: hypothetical protein VMW17_19405 [Candidatus Binatia bacterium]|nr:hypothetical protein [Candidatus Binatia bacterium]
MHVDVSCKKCGARQRLDVGEPGAHPIEEFIRLLNDRLMHRPSFECFGGHLEVAPPVPRFWVVHWETLGD